MLRRVTALSLVVAVGLGGCRDQAESPVGAPQPLTVPDDLCALVSSHVTDQTRWQVKAVEHATEGGDEPRATCRLEGESKQGRTVVEFEWVPTRTVKEARAELAADCQITVTAPVATPSAMHCEHVSRNDKGLAIGEVARADLAADLPGVLVSQVSTTSTRLQPTAAGELHDVAVAVLGEPGLKS